jgi:hypothetical protein
MSGTRHNQRGRLGQAAASLTFTQKSGGKAFQYLKIGDVRTLIHEINHECLAFICVNPEE